MRNILRKLSQNILLIVLLHTFVFPSQTYAASCREITRVTGASFAGLLAVSLSVLNLYPLWQNIKMWTQVVSIRDAISEKNSRPREADDFPECTADLDCRVQVSELNGHMGAQGVFLFFALPAHVWSLLVSFPTWMAFKQIKELPTWHNQHDVVLHDTMPHHTHQMLVATVSIAGAAILDLLSTSFSWGMWTRFEEWKEMRPDLAFMVENNIHDGEKTLITDAFIVGGNLLLWGLLHVNDRLQPLAVVAQPVVHALAGIVVVPGAGSSVPMNQLASANSIVSATSASPLSTSTDNPPTCTICLDDLNAKGGRMVNMISCMHNSFHQSCIDKWTNKAHTCPLCRAPAP